ncbi:hypothetical protein FHX44_117769 [Pseudonocardia hierapolitana]|uniref:Ig-like domain-containing protein n=1 Tax=Pseudonocardia hierapolitana TaxID=1128676 RepID=A0A561T3Y5_9PSEU|nr:hypothetical protein [Pseudonocardia hierapolitana]TWF81824.1 hypothetical protein FHX44_117769 [Pseudonocardia hierapolitana]
MVGLAGLLVALVVPVLPASPPDVPELELSAQEAAPGAEVGVIGRGYTGCIPPEPTSTPEPTPDPENISVDPHPVEPPPVILRWESEEAPQGLGEATLEDDGSFATTITVPADAGAEPFYEVSASCRPGPGFDEIVESAVLVVVVPPEPTTTPPTTGPPPTTERPPTVEPTGEPSPTGIAPTPARPPEVSGSPALTSSGSDVLLAALAGALVVGFGLVWLTRAVRRRSRRPSRAPSVAALAVPAPPGLLDVRPRGPERTVALRVVVRVEPGVLSVHRSEE